MARQSPLISHSAFVAEGAIIRGDVFIADRSSVWFNAVIRGDEGPVLIAECTNIQDCCVLHSDLDNAVDIGAYVTIGHGAVVRGARIEDRVMIGMNAVVMTGATIGEGSVVGAASFVTYNTEVPPYSMVYGSPAAVVRPLHDTEKNMYRVAADQYLQLAEEYRSGKWKGP